MNSASEKAAQAQNAPTADKDTAPARKLRKKMKPSCETCVHFEWDDDYDAEMCNLDLDEDEVYRFEQHRDVVCPYYRYYDEYKSVQKQN